MARDTVRQLLGYSGSDRFCLSALGERLTRPSAPSTQDRKHIRPDGRDTHVSPREVFE